jgi:hypothetical protein
LSWLDATPDLLEVTRGVLRGELLPALPPERRYQGAMIANALAIATRELRVGAAGREAERAALAALLDASGSLLDELRRRLCREIRAGAWDKGQATELRPILQAAVRNRLAISNPDRLAREDG